MTKTEVVDCPSVFDDKDWQIQMWHSDDFVYFNWYKKEIQISYELEDFVEILKAIRYTQKCFKENDYAQDDPQSEQELQKIKYESENSSVYWQCQGLDKNKKAYFELNVPPVALTLTAEDYLQITTAFFTTEESLKKRGLI